MQGTIEDIVNDSHGEESKELAFAIGNAYSALVAWHIRGAERKKYLEMVIHYYEKAGAGGCQGSCRLNFLRCLAQHVFLGGAVQPHLVRQ